MFFSLFQDCPYIENKSGLEHTGQRKKSDDLHLTSKKRLLMFEARAQSIQSSPWAELRRLL